MKKLNKINLILFIMKDKILRANISFNIIFFLYISVVFISINIIAYTYGFDYKKINIAWSVGFFMLMLYKIKKGIL